MKVTVPPACESPCNTAIAYAMTNNVNNARHNQHDVLTFVITGGAAEVDDGPNKKYSDATVRTAPPIYQYTRREVVCFVLERSMSTLRPFQVHSLLVVVV